MDQKVEPLAVLTSLALAGATAIQARYDASTSIWSDAIAWVLLASFFALTKGCQVSKGRAAYSEEPSPWLSWSMAIDITVFSTCSSFVDARWVMPLMTPALILTRTVATLKSLPTSNSPVALRLSPSLTTSVAASFAVGVVTVLCLTWGYDDLSFLGVLIAVLAGCGLAGFLVTFTVVTSSDMSSYDAYSIHDVAKEITWRCAILISGAAVITTSWTNSFVVTWMALQTVLTSGLISTCCLALFFEIAHRASVNVTTTINTYAVAAVQSLEVVSPLRTFALALVCLSALFETAQLLPKTARFKSALALFQLLPLFALLQYLPVNDTTSQAANLFRPSPRHPIETLAYQASNQFAKLRASQSTTYESAHREYVRRYHRDPPPGFDRWFEYAVQHKAPIIDNYDMINDALTPLWKISGKDLTRSMDAAKASDSGDPGLWRCGYHNDEPSGDCAHFGEAVTNLLRDIGTGLPGVELLVNPLDEPRAMFSRDVMKTQQVEGQQAVKWRDRSTVSVWPLMEEACRGLVSNTTKSEGSAAVGHTSLFMRDKAASLDLCQHAEYQDMHGFLVAPTTFRVTQSVVPILSQAALSTMNDVLIPPPAYNSADFMYDESEDIPWDEKSNTIYWAGSTTGSMAVEDNWLAHHRQRFVNLASDLQPAPHTYLQRKHGRWQSISSSYLNTSLYDVHFTGVIQCGEKQCDDEKAYFQPIGRVERDAAFKARLTFDTDGNGISGRFYRLLASRSLPLKQTIFREWHDERLVPWVHYVPVSLGMEELPELVRYLTSDRRGRQIAKRIAMQGREWYGQALRRQDQGLYIWRLLLELARLQDPERMAE